MKPYICVEDDTRVRIYKSQKTRLKYQIPDPRRMGTTADGTRRTYQRHESMLSIQIYLIYINSNNLRLPVVATCKREGIPCRLIANWKGRKREQKRDKEGGF